MSDRKSFTRANASQKGLFLFSFPFPQGVPYNEHIGEAVNTDTQNKCSTWKIDKFWKGKQQQIVQSDLKE